MFTAMETKKDILYIDTGGSLSATRIKDMLQGWNKSLDDQVSNMHYRQRENNLNAKVTMATSPHHRSIPGTCHTDFSVEKEHVT